MLTYVWPLLIYWLLLFVACYIVVEYGQNYLYDEPTPNVALKVALGSLVDPTRQPARGVRPRTAAEVAFLGLGPAAETFLRAAAAAGTLRLEHELQEIAELEAIWGRTVVIRALERATRFRRLFDRVAQFGGRYFLTYQRWATRAQVEACYPQFVEFLRLKKKYDPQERFQSDWYRHYRAMFADQL